MIMRFIQSAPVVNSTLLWPPGFYTNYLIPFVCVIVSRLASVHLASVVWHRSSSVLAMGQSFILVHLLKGNLPFSIILGRFRVIFSNIPLHSRFSMHKSGVFHGNIFIDSWLRFLFSYCESFPCIVDIS